MDIKQEDLVRFWTWCGWEYMGKTNSATSGLVLALKPTWRFKTGEHIFRGKTIPNYDTFYGKCPDLNPTSIYKFAIPKLQKEGLAVTLIAYAGSRFNARIIVSSFRNLQELANESADSPTEALYNAILKVIKNEGR
jgi:hypothetical protein